MLLESLILQGWCKLNRYSNYCTQLATTTQRIGYNVAVWSNQEAALAKPLFTFSNFAQVLFSKITNNYVDTYNKLCENMHRPLSNFLVSGTSCFYQCTT